MTVFCSSLINDTFFPTDVATTCGYGQDQSHRKVITFQALREKIPHQIKSLYPIEEMEGVFPYWASEASPTLGCSIEISRGMSVGMYVCMSVVVKKA